MITGVTYKPVWISPVYNPIVWSVLSSKINSTDFKYVFDIYEVNTGAIQRIKQRANPSGYGMIDISTLVQGYLESSNPNAQNTQGELTIDWVNGHVFADNYLMSKKYYVKVGEEYTVNGITSIYNGNTDTIGQPAYELWSGNTQYGVTTTPVTAFSATLEDTEQQWQMQSTFKSGIFGGNPFNYNINYDHNLGLAHPLNFAELEQEVYGHDNTVLTYLNWTPITQSGQQNNIFGFRFQIYDTAGVLQDTQDMPMITANGYSQRVDCNATPSTDARYSLVHVLASVDKLFEVFGWSGGPGYKITIQGFSKGSGCDFADPVTLKSTFTILEQCTPLYPQVRLSWFNTLGGRDYQNFTMFTEKTLGTTQDNYYQEQIDYSSSKPVPKVNNTNTLDNSFPIGSLAIKGGNKPFNKQAETTYSLQTDWLTQEQVDLMEGLIKSPQVLAYIYDPKNTLAHVYPYNCTVTVNSYTTKNVRQTKLVQASVTIKLANSQKLQNL